MSERPCQNGPDNTSIFYWGWLSREEPESDVYRWITTTPGITEVNRRVDDPEQTVRDFINARKNHLMDIVNGWNQVQNGLNSDIAKQLLSEALAGCRTLLDFETRNFSQKNKAKTRDSFPSHYSGNPILLKEPVAELEKKELLPTTPVIFQSQYHEFYKSETTNLYYEMLLGDAKIFDAIMQTHNKTPNMPFPRVAPMPYDPNGSPALQHTTSQQQMFQPIYQTMGQPVPMQYLPPQQIMMAYPMVPQYVSLQMPFPNFAGAHYFAPNEERRGSRNRQGQINGIREQEVDDRQQPTHVPELENVTTSSSSSSSTANQNVAVEEDEASREAEGNQSPDQEEAGPSTSEQNASGEENVVDGETVSLNSAPKMETTEAIIPTVRKFSDVVSCKVKTTTPRASTSTSTKQSEFSIVKINESELKKTSNVNVSTDKDYNVTRSSVSAEKREEGSTAKAEAIAANVTSVPATTVCSTATEALVVDTSEQVASSAPPTSRRTLAEIVQHSLSAASSPATALQIGASSNQPSPITTSCKGRRSQKEIQASHASGNIFAEVPVTTGIKRQSISYAEILNASPREVLQSSSQNSYTSRSSVSSDSSNTPKEEAKKVSKNLDDWQIVNPKKAAEACVLEPVHYAKPARKNPPKAEVIPAPSESEDDVKSDDPDAEKKRQKRREKRQKLKEANRQHKQSVKEIARQESLARVNAMNGNAPIQPTPPPVFDRNNLAARRRKRQELQNKTHRSGSVEEANKSTSPPKIPIIPILKGQSIGSSISAGQAAMAAYGLPQLSNQFRHSSSPFAIIAPDSNGTIPLFLPDANHPPLRVASFDETSPTPLAKQLGLDELLQRREVDENAAMIEKLLMFHSLELAEKIDCTDSDRAAIVKGIDDVKRMYVRVEKAGKLIAYKQGCSKVTAKSEEKLLNLAIKLLSTKLDLTVTDDSTVSEIASKVSDLSPSFSYTNFLSSLLDYSQERAGTLPDGTNLRKNYEQTVVLAKVFLKRTKNLYEKIGKVFDFNTIDMV